MQHLAGLELAVQTRLSSSSQRFLCLQSAGIKVVHQHALLGIKLLILLLSPEFWDYYYMLPCHKVIMYKYATLT